MRTGDESGQATILVVGVCLVCFAVGGLAVDGMRVLLERRALQSLADSAARAAASSLDLTEAYGAGTIDVGLDADAARGRAARMLDGRTLESASVSVSETSVVVEVRREIAPTFLRAVGISTLRVSAAAAAKPVFGEL